MCSIGYSQAGDGDTVREHVQSQCDCCFLLRRRYQHASLPVYGQATDEIQAENLAKPEHAEPPASQPHAFRGNLTQDDAFGTIIQWLYHKIDDTR